MKIITTNMLNGGCGKSSIVLNLAQALRLEGKRVLEIDLDFQKSLTNTHRVKTKPNEMMLTAFELFTHEEIDTKQFIQNDLIASNTNLMALDMLLFNKEDNTHILKRALETIKKMYDYVLIDTHNEMNLATKNALACCNMVLMPMTSDIDNINGLNNLIASIQTIKKQYNPNIKQLGLVFTMFEKNKKLDKECYELAQELATRYNLNLMPIIRKDTKIQQAKANLQNIFDFNPKSNGANDYRELAKYIIENC